MRKITPSAEQSSSKKILFLKTPSKGRRDRLYPMRVSVDAIFPITLDHEGRTVIHGAGNLAVVPYCINLAKWVHLPITLNFLCRYIRAHQAGPSQEELANLQAALIDDCGRLGDIRFKIPKSNKGRMQLQITPEQLQYLKEEWISSNIT